MSSNGTILTYQHIKRVQYFMCKCISDFVNRQLNHDNSKLHSPEVEGFAIASERLKGLTYGTE